MNSLTWILNNIPAKTFYKVLGLSLILGASSLLGQSGSLDLGPKSLLHLKDQKGVTGDEEFDSLDQLGIGTGGRFLYDASSIGFDKDGQRYLFQGDVVLIGGASIITADTIEVDYKKKNLQARGHVILLSGEQLFTGRKITMYWESGDFVIEDSVMVVNDGNRAKQQIEYILGVSPEESVFQSAKGKRLAEIEAKKLAIREQVIRLHIDGKELRKDFIEAYQLLLEQELLAKSNSNPGLAKKSEKRRKSYLKRRKYWEESREQFGARSIKQRHYLKISGRVIEKRDEYDFYAEDAVVTPCRCEDDEDPAWGFRADHIKAQEEGYVDMYHPVLTIKGMPLLYIPFLRVPFKSRRQSGFLMPGMQTGDQKNGFVYTQPIYYAFADDADATVTFDLFQKRGTRLGLQTRYEMKKYSGFELNMETIRDRIWVQQGSLRNELLDYHVNESPYCSDPDLTAEELDECVENVSENLASPGNSWRGRQEWNGKFFLSPRLSVVSRGSLVSDHRYVEDLYLPEDYVAAFSTKAQGNAFSTSKARMNYDHSDFFVTAGTSYGDNVLLQKQFQGQQIPGFVKLNTRMFSLNPKLHLGIPIYGNMKFSNLIIEERNNGQTSTLGAADESLGNGTWQSANLALVSPIVREGVMRVDYFSDLEMRRIQHDGLDKASSTIESWRSGLTLNLPIDGMGPFPKFLQSGGDQTKYLHHIMNWSLTYSARPYVTRRGPYGEEDSNGTSMYYFASDRDFLVSDGRDVSAEDTMLPHQRLTLSTSHRWKTFDRGWKVMAAQIPEEEKQKMKFENLHDQAKRELLYSLDRKVDGSDKAFKKGEDGKVDWYINRYQLTDTNAIEPVSFGASMTFDYEQERRRQKQIDLNNELEALAATSTETDAAELRSQVVPYYSLPESWSGPNINLGINWAGYYLNTRVSYNIYKRSSASTQFNLSLPSFWSTSLSFAYVFEKSPELQIDTGDLLFKRTKTSSVSIGTGLIPLVSTGISLVSRQTEGSEDQYGTSINLSYTDKSGCWGLRFVREKDLNQDEANANYIFQLSVIFLGNSRSGDLSPGLEREIPRFTIKN